MVLSRSIERVHFFLAIFSILLALTPCHNKNWAADSAGSSAVFCSWFHQCIFLSRGGCLSSTNRLSCTWRLVMASWPWPKGSLCTATYRLCTQSRTSVRPMGNSTLLRQQNTRRKNQAYHKKVAATQTTASERWPISSCHRVPWGGWWRRAWGWGQRRRCRPW